MPQQQDYILRLIEQLSAVIRLALDRLSGQDPVERPEVAGEALGLALSMDPGTASTLSPRSLASLLELGEVDARVMVLLQQALELEATALEDHGDLTTAMLRRDQTEAVRSLLAGKAETSLDGAVDGADVSYTA